MQEAEEIQQAGGDALDDKELVATGQPPPELVSIRLSLEEALFMLWGHRILRAFDADRGSALAELSPEVRLTNHQLVFALRLSAHGQVSPC